MKALLKSLFSESKSISMLRVMAFICCIAAVVIALVGLNKPTIDYSGLSLLCATFLSSAFGGKIMQKRIEMSGAKAEVEVNQAPSK